MEPRAKYESKLRAQSSLPPDTSISHPLLFGWATAMTLKGKRSRCVSSLQRANLSCTLPPSLHSAISVEIKGFVFLFRSKELQNRLMKQRWSGHFMCFPRIRIMDICFASLLITRVQIWKHLYTLTLKNDTLLTHRVPAQQNWLTNIAWIQRNMWLHPVATKHLSNSLRWATRVLGGAAPEFHSNK